MTNKDLNKILVSINNKRGTIFNGYRNSMYVLSEVEELKGFGLYMVSCFSEDTFFLLKENDSFVAILYLGHFHYYVPKKYRGKGYAKKIAEMVRVYVNDINGQSLRTEIHGEDQEQHDASEHIIRDIVGMTIDPHDGRYHLPSNDCGINHGNLMFDILYNGGWGLVGYQPKKPFTCGIHNGLGHPDLKAAVKVISNEVLLIKPLLDSSYYIAVLGSRTHRILSVMQLCGGENIYYHSRSPYLSVKRESRIMNEVIIPYLKKTCGDYEELLLVFERRNINDLALTGEFAVNRYGEIELKMK